MSTTSPNSRHERFRVRLGLTSVEVTGSNRREALRDARRKLCDELPRMWDVIHQLDDQRFQIDPVERNPGT